MIERELPRPADPAGPLDGVRLAVLTSRLESVVRSMMNTLVRTGRSGVINTARDFSCCILSAEDELLVMAESLPIHLMSGPDLMARSMREFHPEFRKGDAFLHNSPYHGNSHAADHSLLVPVFDDDGVHRLTAFVKAHQADCGNAAPTTYAAQARDVYEEGAPIFPCVRVQDDYQNNEDIIRICRARIRVPDQWWGDFLALVGAARIGERLALELGREVGWDTLAQYRTAWFDYSERLMRDAISQLPAGVAKVSTRHDPFPGVPEGIPVNVSVQAHPAEGRIEVDLRDNVDCQPCGLNLSEATARTSAMIGVFNGIPTNVPANSGSFRCIDVHLRENCVVGIPRFPASCSAATTNVADRVTNSVQRAIAELGDGNGLAEASFVIQPSAGVISGHDPARGGEPFVNQVLLAYGSGPGGPHADGWLTLGHAGAAGVPCRDSVELDELRFPIRISEQRIVPDLEGAGQFRGAPVFRVEYGPTQGPIEVMYAADGTQNPPLGARGGQPGAPADQYKRGRDGGRIDVEACGRVLLEPGESIVSIASAGAGYGSPLDRDPEAVRRDVAEGRVTRERAADTYGVVLDDDGAVDLDATAARREARQENR